EALAAADDEPVVLADAFGGQRVHGAAPRAVVLNAAAHVIRRREIVVDVIELRERDAVQRGEVLRAVVRHLKAAVAAAQHALRVLWIDPQRLMIAVNVSSDGAERSPAVL